MFYHGHAPITCLYPYPNFSFRSGPAFLIRYFPNHLRYIHECWHLVRLTYKEQFGKTNSEKTLSFCLRHNLRNIIFDSSITIIKRVVEIFFIIILLAAILWYELFSFFIVNKFCDNILLSVFTLFYQKILQFKFFLSHFGRSTNSMRMRVFSNFCQQILR